VLQHLRASAPDNGAAWQRLVAGGSIEAGGARIDVQSPPRPEWERRSTRNEDSLVLRVSFGDVAIWLTGDAGIPVEQALIGDGQADDPARIRVLKVGHHGSRSATSAAWLEHLRPQVALVSAGRGNLFGHPAAEVVERLGAAGVRLFRTDRDGAVVLETDGRRLRVTGHVLRRVSVW
jgi:competence protein ComEC